MDWKTLIQDLMNVGLTQASIAASVDSGQSHISCLYRGDRKTPNWDLGQRLLKLHAKHCKAKKAA
jgi:hypothetical protein